MIPAAWKGARIESDPQMVTVTKDPHLRIGIRRESLCSFCGLKEDCLIVESMAPSICLPCLIDLFGFGDDAWRPEPPGHPEDFDRSGMGPRLPR